MQPQHKIKIGFISQLFRFDHIVGSLMHGILSQIDRSLFHIELIHFGKARFDNVDIFHLCDQLINLHGRNLAQCQEDIAQSELDILIYPEIGMEAKTYFLAFSRLAPVQCVLAGHPVTTGIPNIDYYLSCTAYEPENAQEHYTEQLIRFNSEPYYISKPSLPQHFPIRLMFDLDADWRLYACPQMLFKIHPDMDGIFAEILRQDPKGRLLLVDHEVQYLAKAWLKRFRGNFPDVADQVIVLKRMPYDQFCALLEHVDALLDPIHFGGGTTSLATFAVGAPVVTLAGAFMRGRVTAGSYQQMGIQGAPVATSHEEYVQLALRLAQDTVWQGELRQAIAQNNHVLFERVEAIRDLEVFLIEAHQAALEKRQLERV